MFVEFNSSVENLNILQVFLKSLSTKSLALNNIYILAIAYFTRISLEVSNNVLVYHEYLKWFYNYDLT